MARISITLSENFYKQLQKQATLNCRSISKEIEYLIKQEPDNTLHPFISEEAKQIMSELTPDLIDSVQELRCKCARNHTQMPPPLDDKDVVPIKFKITDKEYSLINSLKEAERIDTIDRDDTLRVLRWATTPIAICGAPNHAT